MAASQSSSPFSTCCSSTTWYLIVLENGEFISFHLRLLFTSLQVLQKFYLLKIPHFEIRMYVIYSVKYLAHSNSQVFRQIRLFLGKSFCFKFKNLNLFIALLNDRAAFVRRPSRRLPSWSSRNTTLDWLWISTPTSVFVRKLLSFPANHWGTRLLGKLVKYEYYFHFYN